MNKNTVITGAGAITPIGFGVNGYLAALHSGACGIDEIRSIDTTGLDVHRAGEIKGFDPKDHMPKKIALDTEPFAQYAYAAAAEALADSGLKGSDRVGCVMGTALHGTGVLYRNQKNIDIKGRSAEPKLMTKYMGNIAASRFCIENGISGASLTVSTACSSGGDALFIADMLIKTGACDAVVVMAGESAVNVPDIQSLSMLKALSPTGESRPFDVNRNGFVLGEGGGAIILENEESALKRGAEIRARLLACANNNDAFHPVSPHPEGKGAEECMRLALEKAGLHTDSIGYVNAHGTATQKGDIAEFRAVSSVFGTFDTYTGSTKGATGHMMAAGGLTEVIACIDAVRTGRIPPNTGLTEKDPDFASLNIPGVGTVKKDIRAALSNAMGFGGQNSCVIVGKYEE